MTTTTDRVALTATVKRLGAELIRAQKDVALLQRLKNAEADAGIPDTTFVITVTGLTYNGWETVPEVLTYSGFRTVP